jgi:hypothetical protein
MEKNRLGKGWEVALDLSSIGTGFELYNASRFGSENSTAGFKTTGKADKYIEVVFQSNFASCLSIIS